jgi:hypothetical protein
MSQLVKTKRQANFKDFKRFEAFKGLVEQKNVVFNSFMCKLGLFGTRGPNLHTNSLNKLLHITKLKPNITSPRIHDRKVFFNVHKYIIVLTWA